jgi:hypothetical protein
MKEQAPILSSSVTSSTTSSFGPATISSQAASL